MTYKEAIKVMEDIKSIIRLWGNPIDQELFIADQGIEVGLRACYKRRYLEIWKVKGEVRMRINCLMENIYYSRCAIIKINYITQLKLNLK